MLLLTAALHSAASEVADVLEAWSRPRCYNADVQYSVWMPQRDDPVKYNVKLSQCPPAGDVAILPCDYTIEWEYLSGETPTTGFSAYTDGNHYRYTGNGRLNEYHLDTDSMAFNASRPSASVQRSAQFASLLPAVAAIELTELLAGPDWVATIKENILTAEMMRNGSVVSRRRYILGNDSLPLSLLTESNIGSISEQSTEVVYTPTGNDCVTVCEEALIKRFPDQFANYRQSNYSIANLVGKPLPLLTLNTPTGERYRHNRGDGFRRPTVIALLDAEAAPAPLTVQALRDAVDRAPIPADLILAVSQPDIDMTEQLLGALRPGEHHLMGARTWATDVGAPLLPVVIVCDNAGLVTKVITGHNQDLASIVIDALLNQ